VITETSPSLVSYWEISTSLSSTNLGWTTASARDVDLDGYSDLLLGIPAYETYEGGNAVLFTPAPPSPVVQQTTTIAAASGWDRFQRPLDGTRANINLGASVTAIRADADAKVDLVVSGPADAASDAYDPGVAYVDFDLVDSSTSIVYLSNPTAGADVRLAGETAGDVFGNKVADVGDIDGDGLEDLAISAMWHGSLRGRIYILRGSYLSTLSGAGPNLGTTNTNVVHITGTATDDTNDRRIGLDLATWPSAANATTLP
jgi:hypothetical protein